MIRTPPASSPQSNDNLSIDGPAALSYKPTVVKSKTGQHFWQVEDLKLCSDFCKSQLKVSEISTSLIVGCDSRIQICIRNEKASDVLA